MFHFKKSQDKRNNPNFMNSNRPKCKHTTDVNIVLGNFNLIALIKIFLVLHSKFHL